jgi:hypothetical protein
LQEKRWCDRENTSDVGMANVQDIVKAFRQKQTRDSVWLHLLPHDTHLDLLHQHERENANTYV